MYRYQETARYFAQVADDIKDIAEQELRTLGAQETSPTYRGIYFTASPQVLYTINFSARLITPRARSAHLVQMPLRPLSVQKGARG